MYIPLEVIGAVFQVVGSAFAKLAFEANSPPALAVAAFCSAQSLPVEYCRISDYATRAVCVALLLICNGLGLRLYVSGMQRSGSLLATVLSTATNTLCTAAIGAVLFGETLSMKWGLGAAMICIGVILLNSGAKPAVDRHAAAAASVADTAVAEAEPVSHRLRQRKGKHQ